MKRMFLAAMLILVLAPMGLHAADEQQVIKVLFLGDGGHHKPAERSRQLIPVMLRRGIHLVYTENADDLNPQTLARYQAVLLYANIDTIKPEQAKALLDYVAKGGGFVPVHCASYCFRNDEQVVALIGGQFKKHGTGTFKTTIVAPEHEIMKGFTGFESWDETYEHHKHNEKDRTVLEKREDEPYTWVRTHGKGRVFYTAWGHDQRTWSNPGFVDLLERGIRWAVKQDVQKVLAVRKELPALEYEEAKVAYYPPPTAKPVEGEWNQMQKPLPPQDAIKRLIVPGGFEVQLFASEPDIHKPIAIAWDERGRLWVAETVDYPNNLQAEGEGHDQIKICEDTDGDGKADKFTVFADKLSIPTSFTFANGGIIVQQAPKTLFLKDTNGDDKADVRQVLIEGWNTNDTHAGPNNLRYGLDNWIWGMIGYAGFKGDVGGESISFTRGFYRLKPDASKLEFIRNTNNNTWGIGQSEEGVVFGSTANNNPSVYMPIAARYYTQAKGSASTLGGIADSSRFLPSTGRIRQVDVHWGYTAASGHELYTARAYPREYWNRVAFVTEGTGKLVGQFFLTPKGADYTSTNPNNLVSSDDEWFAPVAAAVGPDGAVWIADFYTFVFQHNPTPKGWTVGKGNAYQTDQRSTDRGRIYRVVWKDAKPAKPVNLAGASPAKLVQTLTNDNQLWRLHAQRLLVERGQKDVTKALIKLVQDTSADEIGLNVGAIHALWTLKGLGELDKAEGPAFAAAVAALKHPSAGVRRNAVAVLPAAEASLKAILGSDVLKDSDGQVSLAAWLAVADMPEGDCGDALVTTLQALPKLDRYQLDAAGFAAIRHRKSFLAAASAKGLIKNVEEAPKPNLLPNGSFEEVADGKPVGWKPRTYGGKADHKLAEGGRTGKYCLQISSKEGADTSWYADVTVKPQTRYRLSAWIKTNTIKLAGGKGALLNVHELQGADGSITPALKNFNEWSRVETVFESGDRGHVSINALFGGWGHAIGNAYWDDIELIELGDQGGSAEIVLDRVQSLDRKPDPKATKPAPKVDATLELGVIPDVMKYNKTKLTAKAGQTIRIVFKNTDHMQHNLLLIKPGSLNRIGALADQMMTDPKGFEKQYIPKSEDILAYSALVNPNTTVELVIKLPNEKGEYPYVCTFPGHWRLMQGVLVVE